MAFTVPEHLPRKQLPTDVSSNILAKISEATGGSLNAELAAKWVAELELTIQQTKDRIYERIHEELPDFERQLELSKSVQTRLRDLSLNVDKLAGALENPKTGTLPTLLKSLEVHRELQQRASNARVTYEALSYLGECRSRFEGMTTLVRDGKLKEGLRKSNELDTFLDGAPEAVENAEIMADMREELRTCSHMIDEQLSDAYYRSIRISSTELRISPFVQVRRSEAIISLSDILASLSEVSLETYISSLRRDIVAHFIDFPSQRATSSTVSGNTVADGTPYVSFSIFPLPLSPKFKKSVPAYLKSLFDFLSKHLIPALPPSLRNSFPRSLYRPTANALLNNVLLSSLPSSLSDLDPFLELVQSAVEFEQEYFFRNESAFGGLQGEGELETWGKGVAGHYGRKRRIDLLAETRQLILKGSKTDTIRVEVPEPPETNGMTPEVVPVQGGIDGEEETGWDFDDDAPAGETDATEGAKPAEGPAKQTEEDASGWDFDDAEAGASDKTKVEEVQDDSDAWGWGDDEETSTSAPSEDGNAGKAGSATNGHQVDKPQQSEENAEDAWDTAWDEPEPTPPSPEEPLAPAKAPKVAKGLEKLSVKGKAKGLASPALSSNPPSSAFSASSAFPSSISSPSRPLSLPNPQSSSPTTSQSHRSQSQPQSSPPSGTHLKPPALSLPQKPRQPETYLISSQIQDLIRHISSILSEGQALSTSPIFSSFPSSSSSSADSANSSAAAALVLQGAPAALDLYRAIYPVVFASELTRSARALRFSNDCEYLHAEGRKLIEQEFQNGSLLPGSVNEQLDEALERLHALSAWWLDEGVERVCERILQILSRAEGFVELGEQDRFDECEAVMTDVLREVRTATGEWKPILPRTKWLRAAGRVVETALSRVLSDVLALHDIPEVDSRRLSELCRILNALEGLFVDVENPDPEAPSMVLDYVPSWLKYSYLSELLEASIADISYLFDEGTLIDFSVDELVRLVRALFADTPLRTNTIAKLQRGHPVAVG